MDGKQQCFGGSNSNSNHYIYIEDFLNYDDGDQQADGTLISKINFIYTGPESDRKPNIYLKLPFKTGMVFDREKKVLSGFNILDKNNKMKILEFTNPPHYDPPPPVTPNVATRASNINLIKNSNVNKPMRGGRRRHRLTKRRHTKRRKSRKSRKSCK